MRDPQRWRERASHEKRPGYHQSGPCQRPRRHLALEAAYDFQPSIHVAHPGHAMRDIQRQQRTSSRDVGVYMHIPQPRDHELSRGVYNAGISRHRRGGAGPHGVNVRAAHDDGLVPARARSVGVDHRDVRDGHHLQQHGQSGHERLGERRGGGCGDDTPVRLS